MPNILAFTTEHHLTSAQRDELRAELQKQLEGVDCQLLILPAGVALQTFYAPTLAITAPRAPEPAKAETAPYEDAVAAGRKVVHVDVPDADDKVRFAWVYEGGCSDAQRVFAISTESVAGRTRYAIPVDHLTPYQAENAKSETL